MLMYVGYIKADWRWVKDEWAVQAVFNCAYLISIVVHRLYSF